MRKLRMINWVVLILFYCGTVFAKANNHNPVTTYTEDKSGISVTTDQPQFIIKLKSNPTTGYSWFLRDYDANLVTPVKHTFEASTSKLVGAAGYEFWTFHVKAAGFMVPQQTMIRFVYARPWEDSDQSKQLVFRVSTRD